MLFMAAFASMAMGIDPLIFAMQQTGFFQNAQPKDKHFVVQPAAGNYQIGRASCRERV
mgnify:CR=1 FL=1